MESVSNTIEAAPFVTDIVGNAIGLILFKKVIDHFEGENYGATWTSAALVMYVPWFFDWFLEIVGPLLPNAVHQNHVVGISFAVSALVGRLAIGVALVKWRYRQRWLYSIVLYLGAWILSGLIGIMVGAPIVLALSLFWP